MMLSPIYTEKTECQDCYKCIRQCPVKAIRVENGHAMIIPEQCIMCGRCVINCPSRAKHIRDDLQRVRQLFSLKKRVVASLAPSFVSEFPQYSPEQMVAALISLGFYGVSETAIGADLVSAQITEDLLSAAKSDGGQKLFLSSACPTVVEYIKQCMSEFTPYITDRASPLLAHARYLRAIYGDDIAVVFIGPCIAKKRESDTWKDIDAAITFQDLARWFEQESVRPEKQLAAGAQGLSAADFGFIPHRAAKGSLYPVDGGMIACCKKYDKLSQIHTMAIAGIDEIHDALTGLDNDSLKEPLFIELLSCVGGCINGPGTTRGSSTALKRVRLIDYAVSAPETLDAERPDLTGTLPIPESSAMQYSSEEVRLALRSIGKTEKADELNCASCGYDTCRAFALAMLDNRAEKTMCVSYMRKLAQKKANALIQAIPSGVLIVNKDMQVIECNQNFAELMGEDVMSMYDAKPGLEGADVTRLCSFYQVFEDALGASGNEVMEKEVKNGKQIFNIRAFSIEKDETVAGVIEDITAPQVRKRRIVNKAQKVIEKNLSVVQKIAYLLGENAAETESMLNSIIESFGDDEEK